MDNLIMTKSGKKNIAHLSNFFFCHYVFKKLSAAEASISIYNYVGKG